MATINRLQVAPIEGGHSPPYRSMQQTALDKLQDQISLIEDGEAYEKLAAKREKLESEIDFSAEDKAKSGAIVSIDQHGKLEIIDGLVRQEDRVAAKKKKAEANGEDGNAPLCFSSKLVEDLTANRTAALQAMLADALADAAETKLKGLRWLPELLRAA